MDLLIYFWNLRILKGRPRSLLIQAINSIFNLCLENSRKIPSISGHSILSNLRQNEFLKLLSMETPGLETWIRKWSYSVCFFHSVYSKSTTDVKLLATDVVNPNLLFEVTTTAPELEGILSKINVNKAPGVDNLPARILRTLACVAGAWK